ncbi:RRP7A-like protein [Mya arenaria]|uniref:RRP7A-like protein n=1 Tax=Mya arenaria TaxID=6604 RepID=A0ABY7GA44_MYAAR|nr:ribosomal RNA-processing protein 7 homolog A-like [Mya arenaria]WAR31285.1 RRP7A-like protein [Mya arenaria]
MPSENVVVEGFTVVPMKVDEKSHGSHYLYMKEHSVREANPCKPRDRTLFVLNIPPYCTEEVLQYMFSGCGQVQTVHLHNKPTSGPSAVNQSNFFPTAPLIQGYKVGYVVFKKASSVKKARSLPFDVPLIMQGKGAPTIKSGIEKWCSDYQADVLDRSTLQAEIDTYMAEYDRKVQEEMERAKASEGVPDDEGWVTVTRFGKNKAAPRTEAHEKAISGKEKRRRKEKELLNFYSFQIRQTKRDQIANLRQKFEEDKQRISLMKEARKFRPY